MLMEYFNNYFLAWKEKRMKTIFLVSPKKIELRDIPIPQINFDYIDSRLDICYYDCVV